MINQIDKELMDISEGKRELLRATGKRLAYDCYNLIAIGDRAYCSKGYIIGCTFEGSVPLAGVLRGVTPSVCRGCLKYDDSP